jgi:hypothetical protein
MKCPEDAGMAAVVLLEGKRCWSLYDVITSRRRRRRRRRRLPTSVALFAWPSRREQ